MKEISIVVGYSLELPAIRNRIIPIINKAIEKSFKVNIITSGNKKLDISNKKLNYTFCNIKSNLPVNFIKRGIYEIYFSYKIMKLAYRKKCDFLIITIPNIFNILFCKKLKKTKQILDVRDLSWEYLQNKYIIQRLVKKFFRFIFKLKVNKFNAISCTNQSEFNYIRRFYNKNNENLFLYTNGVNLKNFNDLNHIKQKVLDNKIDITYIGNIGIAQNIKILVEVSKKFPELQFNIVGEGKELNHLIKISKNQTNINFFGRIEWNDLLKVYSQTNILYAQLSSNYSGAMPSKLYEYLATGKFIIYGGCGQSSRILSDFDNNVVIKPDDTFELYKAIKSTIDIKKFNKISHNNKHKIFTRYIRDNTVNSLFKFIENNS